RRDLVARDPGAYRPYVAMTLVNLGILYSDARRLAKAEKAYGEALTIYRDLASTNSAYTDQVAALTKVLAALGAAPSSGETKTPAIGRNGNTAIIGTGQ